MAQTQQDKIYTEQKPKSKQRLKRQTRINPLRSITGGLLKDQNGREFKAEKAKKFFLQYITIQKSHSQMQ
jgi:hypothetical protein